MTEPRCTAVPLIRTLQRPPPTTRHPPQPPPHPLPPFPPLLPDLPPLPPLRNLPPLPPLPPPLRNLPPLPPTDLPPLGNPPPLRSLPPDLPTMPYQPAPIIDQMASSPSIAGPPRQSKSRQMYGQLYEGIRFADDVVVHSTFNGKPLPDFTDGNWLVHVTAACHLFSSPVCDIESATMNMSGILIDGYLCPSVQAGKKSKKPMVSVWGLPVARLQSSVRHVKVSHKEALALSGNQVAIFFFRLSDDRLNLKNFPLGCHWASSCHPKYCNDIIPVSESDVVVARIDQLPFAMKYVCEPEGMTPLLTLEEKKERLRLYREQPHIKERERLYREQPHVKERDRVRRQQPQYKERERLYQRLYREQPHVKERDRVRRQQPQYKERERLRRQQPQYKESKRLRHQQPQYKERERLYREQVRRRRLEVREQWHRTDFYSLVLTNTISALQAEIANNNASQRADASTIGSQLRQGKRESWVL